MNQYARTQRWFNNSEVEFKKVIGRKRLHFDYFLPANIRPQNTLEKNVVKNS